VEVVASLSEGRTAAAQCGLFTHKSVPVIFEPPCNCNQLMLSNHVDICMFLTYQCRILLPEANQQVTNFFVIKLNRCTNFTNLFCHETLHVSDSLSVHHQEFIHCTLSNGICHTGL